MEPHSVEGARRVDPMNKHAVTSAAGLALCADQNFGSAAMAGATPRNEPPATHKKGEWISRLQCSNTITAISIWNALFPDL